MTIPGDNASDRTSLDDPVATLGTGVVEPGRPGARWWMYRHPEDADAGTPVSPPPVSSGVVRIEPSQSGSQWWRYRRPDVARPEPSAFAGQTSDASHEPLDFVENPSQNGSSGTGAPTSIDLDRAPPSAVVPAAFGFALLLVVVIGARLGATGLGTVLIPLAAIVLAFAFLRRATRVHPDEPWLGRLLVYGVVAKLVASYLRYLTLVVSYGGVGDASVYDSFGSELAKAWLTGTTAPELPDLRRTNFLRWFTGVVYYVFGTNMLAGFLVFGLLAFLGSYFWYRATVNAVPFIDKRLYLMFVLFAPSIAFWPSSIGKESLMQLGIGVVALGTSMLLARRLLFGLAVAVAGGWLLWVVRPHLLAMVSLAGGLAYIFGRLKVRGRAGSFLSRPAGIVIISLLVAFTIGQGADFLGIEEFSVSSIESELDAQTERSAQGGSEFDNGGNSLNPINLPRGAVTVLLRPFPWETDSNFQLLSSAESALLAALMVIRFGSFRVGISRARGTPFLLYAWVLMALYAATFSSFANFGLLVRQRSLVLPALFVLLAIDTDRARARPDTDEPPAEAVAGIAERTG